MPTVKKKYNNMTARVFSSPYAIPRVIIKARSLTQEEAKAKRIKSYGALVWRMTRFALIAIPAIVIASVIGGQNRSGDQ